MGNVGLCGGVCVLGGNGGAEAVCFELWVSAKLSLVLCCLQLALPFFPSLFLLSVLSNSLSVFQSVQHCLLFSMLSAIGSLGEGGQFSEGQLLGVSPYRRRHTNKHTPTHTYDHAQRGGCRSMEADRKKRRRERWRLLHDILFQRNLTGLIPPIAPHSLNLSYWIPLLAFQSQREPPQQQKQTNKYFV